MRIVPDDQIWDSVRQEAARDAAAEPVLAGFLNNVILRHETLEEALSFILASKLDSPTVPALTLRDILADVFDHDARRYVDFLLRLHEERGMGGPTVAGASGSQLRMSASSVPAWSVNRVMLRNG